MATRSTVQRLFAGFLAGAVGMAALTGIAGSAGAQTPPVGGAAIEVVPIIPHANALTSAVYTHDGAHIFSGSNDKSIALWDVASGRLLRTFEGHAAEVTAIAPSPDGRRLASASRDGTIQLWDVLTGASIRTLRAHEDRINGVAFALGGAVLASGSADRTIKIWDGETGVLVRSLEGHTGAIHSLAVSPDGRLLVSAGTDLSVKLWDVAEGTLIRSYWGHTKEINTLAFAPGGASFLSGSDDRSVRLWDAASWQELQRFTGHTDIVIAAAFSRDGTRVVSSGKDRSIKLWPASGGAPLQTLEGHTGSVTAVSFAPGDARILSASVDKSLRIWNLASGQVERIFQGPADRINAVVFARDSRHILAGGGDTRIRLWDAATGQLKQTFRGHTDRVIALDIATDGARIVSASRDKTVKIWAVDSGGLLHTLQGHPGVVSSVAFSPDGTKVVTGCVDKIVRVYDAATGGLLSSLDGHTAEINSVAVSPDSTRIASGDDTGTVKLWDLKGATVLQSLKGHAALVAAVRFSPDGRQLASAGWDGAVALWNAADGQLVRTFTAGAMRTTSVAFSPNGAKILTGNSDNALRLWDAGSGTLLETFVGHRGWVSSVAFAADGARFASGGNDGTVKVWHLEKKKFLASLMGSRDGEWLVTTPEGFFAASPNASSMASIVRGFEVYEIDQAYQVLYRPDLVQEKLTGDADGKVSAAARKLDLKKLLDSGHVPKVRVVRNTTDAAVSERVTVTIDIADLGGGIGKVEWRIGGITDGVVADASAASSVTREHVFSLDAGDNLIEVVAYNRRNLVSSVPLRMNLRWEEGQQPKAPPRMHVLVAAINNYWDSKLRLRYAVPDANALAASLRTAGKDLYQEVQVTYALDRDATVAKLEQTFKDLSSRIRPRDVFVFFVAGHGKTEDGKYYLVPQDFKFVANASLAKSLEANGIGQNLLQKWLSGIKAKKSIVIFDTCESGTLTADPQDSFATRGGFEQWGAVSRLVKATGRTTLTAAMDDQPAREGYKNHGVFTYALLDALARGDTNNNGHVEINELIGHVDALVPELTEKRWRVRQVPRSSFQGSNFSVVRQVPSLAPGDGDDAIVARGATHVLPPGTEIRAAVDPAAAVKQTLRTFTSVTLVKTEGASALIAKDGVVLGYVAPSALQELQ